MRRSIRLWLILSVFASSPVACVPNGGGAGDCAAGGNGCPCVDMNCDGTLVCNAANVCVEPAGDGDGDGDGETGTPIAAVDILFVIDNSGSMGEEQGKLAASIGAFLENLEIADLTYRIGFTTTDNGNPWCGATTTPEGGMLVLSSCRGRLDQFTFTGTNPPTVVEDVACTDLCDYEKSELDDQMKPTTTELDPNETQRPWIESLEGATNLPDGIGTVEAFQCFAPQGIDGCGFESHLESMYKAFQRTKSQTESSYGFVRDEAILAVIVVTDEADCSYNSAHKEIFEASGNKVFWSDPDAQYPTSAVCWNAGVVCTGGPGTYDGCSSIDYDVNGVETSDSGEAVLHPISRYNELLEGLENSKKISNPAQEIVVAVLAGVPGGYPSGEADIAYADSEDAAFQNDFGIGPGCEDKGSSQTAIPPVRIRNWAENFGDRNLYSICDDDYAPALAAIADRIVGVAGAG